jgi:DNA-binding IclR family transcriptional regulator
VAAIAIQGPTIRLIDDRLEEFALEAQRTASKLAWEGPN